MERQPESTGLAGARADRPAQTPGPTPLGNPTKHYWLALEMAQTIGLDLQSQIDEGRLDQAGWAAAVTRCRGCTWADGCPSWMERQRQNDAAGHVEAPQACANAQGFNDLLARLERDAGGGQP